MWGRKLESGRCWGFIRRTGHMVEVSLKDYLVSPREYDFDMSLWKWQDTVDIS